MSEDQFYFESLTDREMDILPLKVARYTNQQIAEELHLSIKTVKWYVGQIYSKLNVNNRRELAKRANELKLLDENQPLVSTSSNMLPKQRTSFIGRTQEISDICERLQNTCLLTLTGTGGTGKTRLALEVANRLRDAYRDGIYFVDLAPLSDASLVAKAIAETIGLVENQNESIEVTLQRVLKNRQVLLILDNFEHVLSAAVMVSDLRQATSDLTILVTSREQLNLYAEQEYAVPALTLPALSQSDEERLQNDAVSLFIQRARAVSYRLVADESNLEAIATICRRLDGLPLAIELAAARSKVLPPQAMLKRLDKRLDILSTGAIDMPDRHQTLRNMLAWSYDLLDDAEKRLFARLAVFQGGRSLEACEVVCGDNISIDILDGLASLVDKNLLIQREDGSNQPRFWMLETIQEFAMEQLEAFGEANEIRTRHAVFYCDLAAQAEPELLKANQVKWFKKLEIEMDNIRAILQWTLSGTVPELGIRLLVSLTTFWSYSVHQFDCDRWAHHALQYIEQISLINRGRLYLLIGYFAWRLRRDNLKARGYAHQVFELGQQLNNKHMMAMALRVMGGCVIGRPKELETIMPFDETLAYVQESILLWHELGDSAQLAHSLNTKADILEMLGDYDGAKETYEECIRYARRAGDIRRIQINISNLASLARTRGNHIEATELAKEGLSLAREVRSQYMMVTSLLNITNPDDDAERATHLLAASDKAIQSMGTIRQPATELRFQKYVASARKNLTPSAFQKAWDEGSAMTLDEAVAYALEEA